MTLYKWSQTANSNQGADPTVNWTEGQAPSSLNDSARAMMAATAKYRDDTAGHTQTGGTASAYTFASSQGFTSTSDLNGQEITFIAGATNAQGVTFNVDGIGAFPLAVVSSGALVPAGSLAAGGVYTATFYSSISQWLLRDFYVNPFNIPLAGGMDYWGATVPNSNFAFPAGQAISRVTYATLFAIMGTAYGVGDGSTTFNLPDKTERVSVMKATAASRLTTAGSGVDGGTLGAVGGAQQYALNATQIPAHTHSGNTSTESASHTHAGGQASSQNNFGGTNAASQTSWAGSALNTGTESASHIHGFTTDNGTGGGLAHPNVQPTIVCNYIIRII